MTERKICWSCNSSCAGCPDCMTNPCCENPIPAEIKSPDSPPPYCGKRSRVDIITYVFNLLFPDTPTLHECCMCHQPYIADTTEWTTGTCPHCGAKGLG